MKQRKIKSDRIETIFKEPGFGFLTACDRSFIFAFDHEMQQLGYDFGGNIGSGYCWGKYMIIYTRTGMNSKHVVARIYIRENDIVLRLFLTNIDKHRGFLEKAPGHIKSVFTGPYGDCKHCHNEKDGRCRFRKTYTLDGRMIEKCNGSTFEFQQPDLSRLKDYLALFTEFYPQRKPNIQVRR